MIRDPDPGGMPGPVSGGGQDPGPLRIAVLGPLVITGTAAALQPRQAELMVALALAGTTGLTGESLRGMLGADADHPKPPDSLRQIIARTRRRLGPVPGGGGYITHAPGTGYALHPAAGLDWDDFRGLAARGQADRDPRPLREAFELLRGRPLAGLYYWWLDTALIEAMRAAIVDTAALLAVLELEAADPAAARRAARLGLAADAAVEQLWRLLMLAEDAAGNRAGVHGAWRDCLAAISGIAPAGEPHPDTAALYLELISRPGAISLGHLGAAARRVSGTRAPRGPRRPAGRGTYGRAAG
jgi:DNA-binding SARP family transcriptional activator